jgi:glutathione S-transferase
MFLIGQYDSPFVRRVAIALRLYGLGFEHRPWSTFGDAEKIAPYNPLRRVPTLVLDSGEALIESTIILDYLDELVGPAKAMIAASGPERRHHLKICALAMGLGDKAVSLLYERVLRKEPSKVWVDRCEAQVASRAVYRRALSGAVSACRALRGAAAVSGDRAAARAAEGVIDYGCHRPARPGDPVFQRRW